MRTRATCPICGTEFERIHTWNKVPIYCSHACRNRSDGHRKAVAGGRRGFRTGPDHANFKGEWVETRHGASRAYVWIDDAMRGRLSTKRAYAPRARVVWAQAHPDETITPDEPVHHVNGDSMDDRTENLRKMASKRAHGFLHAAQNAPAVETRRSASPQRCEVCGAPIQSWRRFCSTECVKSGLRGAAHQNTGRHWSPEIRENMAVPQRGKRASPETREKMRQAHLAHWQRVKAGQSEHALPPRGKQGHFV